MDEQALIHDAQGGSLDAFNTLILHYQDSVYNTALRILGDEDLAADVTQEAFISAFKGIASFRGGSFKAWLMRTVTNACYDELRRQKRRPTTPLEPDTEVQYKVSAAYDAALDRSIRPDDPVIGIDWPLAPEQRLLSAKDRAAPLLSQAELF